MWGKLYCTLGSKRKGQKSKDSLAASSIGLCRQLLTCSDLDVLVGSSGGHCGSTHAILDLLGHSHESLLDIGGTLGRGLKERNGQLIGKFLWDGLSTPS